MRWQRKRITFLRAETHDVDGLTPEHERARCLDAIAAKVSDFGGRILDIDSASVTAAFGVEVAEDADERRDRAPLLVAEQAVDDLAGGIRGAQPALVATASPPGTWDQSTSGRISMEPCWAPGMRAADAIAASRSGASIT